MKYIFPKNYNFKQKILGFIDYSTAILNLIIGFLLYFILNLLIKNFSIKLYFFIAFYLPILIFSISSIRKESFVSIIKYIFIFFKNQQIYLYKKE